VVTTVPTSLFGGRMENYDPSVIEKQSENNNFSTRVGSTVPEALNSPNLDGDLPSYTDHHRHSSHRDSHNPIQSRSGQILWIRGLTRLQTQLRVIRAFKSTLEDMEEKRSCHSLHSVRSTRSFLTRPTSDISYIEDAEDKWKKEQGIKSVGNNVSASGNGHYVRGHSEPKDPSS